MHIYTVIKDKVQPLLTERNKYAIKLEFSDDSDVAHLTSFGIEFRKEEEAREN